MEFEIFKTGTHTSDKGITKAYTEEDLNYIASNYIPKEHEAPIVVGHPVDNSPSFGWIESLIVQGDKLIAKAKDVIPEFIDAVKQGIYKKRSISLDKDGKLRHVGFLGGAAPAVKGLADIQFSSEPSEVFEYDFDLSSLPPDRDGIENLPAEAIAKEGQESNIEHSESKVKYPEPQEKLFTSFSSQLDNIQNLLTNLSQNFSEKDSGQFNVITNQISELKFKMNNSDFENKLNEKLAVGSLTPAMKQKTMNLIEYLSTQNFSSEFDLSKYRETVKSLLNEFIDLIPKIIYYENFAEKPENDNITLNKDDYSGLPLDEESAALHKKALSIMKKDNISYQAAILKISKRIN